MDINKLCPKCMNESGNRVCPHCGYDREEDQNNTHALKPFTILGGKYLVGNVIGEGGFGITYIGFDLNLEMKIAVKEFYPNGFVTRESGVTNTVTGFTTSDPAQFQKWKDSFVREAKNLARFSNLPGIVRVRDFFQENNTAYIVMEYVEGETLKDYLKKRNQPLSVNETLEMMEPVIRSLSRVHSGGIIHRDISPDNIMIQEGGGVRLIDFGAAREFDSGNEKSMSVLLKPGYAPEEQYRSKGEQGPWTDVYALSATIYRCITGIKPVESMERMRTDGLKKPSEMGVGIAPETENALLKGMAVFAENRIRSMDELGRALFGNTGFSPVDNNDPGTMTGAGSVHAPAPAPVKKASNPASKNNKLLVIIIGVTLILLIILAFIIMIIMGSKGNSSNSGFSSALGGSALFGKQQEINDNAEEMIAEEDTSSDEKEQEVKEVKEEEKEEVSNYTEDKSIHSYDYIIADVTWEEAFRNAANNGGYLLHMNSDEEAAYIINELKKRNMTNISFFIGGARKEMNDDYHWLDPEGEPFGSKLNDDQFSDYWLPGEPSFTSDGLEERYMDMIYRKSDGRWYWNDVPNDLIQASAVKSGRLGYIVEYENGLPERYGEIPQAEPAYGNDDYLLPESDSRYCDYDEIRYFDKEELRIARNEIYARHGYIFKDEALSEYFSRKDWYYPVTTNVPDTELNKYEIHNRDLIKSVEEMDPIE